MLIKHHEKQKEEQYMITFMACYNAMGAINIGKKFKIRHPFQNSEEGKNTPTIEARNETLDFIKSRTQKESG